MRNRNRYILTSGLLSACVALIASSPLDDNSARFDAFVHGVAFAQDEDPFADEDDGASDPFGADEESDPFAGDEDSTDADADSGLDSEDADPQDPFSSDDNSADPFAPSSFSEPKSTPIPAPANPAAQDAKEVNPEREKYARPEDVPDDLKTEEDFYATLTAPERSILYEAPKNGADYFAAAVRIARVGRIQFAKLLAEKGLGAQEATPEESAAAIESVGSGNAANLVANPDLGQAGTDLYMKTLESARIFWEDETRLTEAFANVTSGTPTVRSSAMTAILRGGPVAVKMAIRDLMGDDPAKAANAKSLMPIFESDGVQALIAALRDAPDADVAPVADALGEASDVQGALELVARFYATQDPDAKRALQDASAKQFGAPTAIPPAADVAKLAYDSALGYYNRTTRFANVVEDQASVWRWNAEKREVYREKETLDLAYLTEAARWAMVSYRIAATVPADQARVTPREVLDLAIVAVSERAATRVGLDSARLGVPELNANVANLTAGDLVSALAFALKTRHYNGALIPTILLQDLGDESLVAPYQGGRSVVVRAAMCPSRRERYEALTAIMKWNPSKTYIGASDVERALAWFATGSGERVAVVSTPRLAEASQIGREFVAQGYKVVQTTTGRDAILAAQSSADVEFVFVTADTSLPDARVVAQTLKADPRTADVPLLVGFSDERERGKANALVGVEPNAYVAPTPYDLESSVWALGKLFERAKFDTIPSEARLEQAKKAARATLAAAVSRPNIYDQDVLNDATRRMLSTPTLFDEGLEYAATIKTSYAQNALVDMIGDLRFNASTRRRALEAFERQLSTNGSLLRGPDVKRMYDRYNASEKEDAETQKILSDMLDVYEKLTGRL